MTSGNPAIGQPQGVGAQPYQSAQSPRIESSTLGGIQPDMANANQIAAVQALLDATVADAIQHRIVDYGGGFPQLIIGDTYTYTPE